MMVMDLICKMEVDEHKTKFSSKYNNRDYYFCSAGCKATFEKKPGEYAK